MADFSLAFKQLNDLTIKEIEDIIRKSVFDLTNSIIMDTPVDTGRARGNWFVSFDNPINSELDNLDKNGTSTISKAQSKIINNPIPQVYWIQNNLPYILRLEYGWSKQSPAGMVRRNILRFNQFLKGNIK